MKVFLWLLVAGVLVAIVMAKKNVKKVSEEEDDDEESDDEGGKDDIPVKSKTKPKHDKETLDVGDDSEMGGVGEAIFNKENVEEALDTLKEKVTDKITNFFHNRKENKRCCKAAGVQGKCLKLCKGKSKDHDVHSHRFRKCKEYSQAILQCAEKND